MAINTKQLRLQITKAAELIAFYAFVDNNPYPDDRISDMIAEANYLFD